ncbi:MAG: dihydroorotase [Rikenellaceae bacterium]
MRIVLKGAEYYTRKGLQRADIAVEDGVITQIGSDLSVADSEVCDLAGSTIFPGLVDVHVHLREPGFSHKETILSGSKAAARGGVTTLFTMPNLSPAPDSVENVQQQLDIIARDAVVECIPYGAITVGQKGRGELVDFESLAPMVGGFSDDGRGVQEDGLMEQAMEQAKAVGRKIVAHCEIDALLFKGYIHDGEYCKKNNHRGICSESEWGQVKRDIELVEQIGCEYHVCHISTKESVELIREAKAKGLKVSCETAPHYLLLTDNDIEDLGRFKMNPPIRSAEDRAALIEGIKDGTIDAIATDHAPHSEDEKSRGLAMSAFGVVGIEFSFATMYTHFVKTGVITLDRCVELMSSSPRELFGVGGGVIEVGAKADLVAFDLNHEYNIDPAEFVSMGKATPLEGLKVQGRTKLTLAGGKVVYREI